MTDDDLDRMIRNADPYRPEIGELLDGAAQQLLEDIVSTPTLERVTEAPGRRRRRLTWPAVGAGLAAAAVAGVFALSASGGEPAGRSPSTSESTAGTYSALALKAAESTPRLLIDEPGWKIVSVYGFAEETGTIRFANGDREVAMNWYAGGRYGSYREDRKAVSAPEKVTVDGQDGDLFRYSATNFAVMLPPGKTSFAELRLNGFTRAEAGQLLTHVVNVDVRDWLGALPPEVVTADRADDRAAEILTGVPLPPGFDATEVRKLGTNDAYQFGAQVAAKVGCGWIEEWQRAKAAGDTAALQRASDALRGSHDWQFLKDMEAGGDYPMMFWRVADKFAAGKVAAGYEATLGC